MGVGSAAEWVAAIGTSGTLAVAVAVLVRDQSDRRMAQARRVNAWATAVGPRRDVTEHGVLVGMDGNSVVVHAENGSSEPVYDFLVWVHHNYDPASHVTGSLERRILGPGTHTITVDGIGLPESGLAGMPHVDVTFRDAAGRRWQRLHDGNLSPDRLSRHGRRSRKVSWARRLAATRLPRR